METVCILGISAGRGNLRGNPVLYGKSASVRIWNGFGDYPAVSDIVKFRRLRGWMTGIFDKQYFDHRIQEKSGGIRNSIFLQWKPTD